MSLILETGSCTQAAENLKFIQPPYYYHHPASLHPHCSHNFQDFVCSPPLGSMTHEHVSWFHVVVYSYTVPHNTLPPFNLFVISVSQTTFTLSRPTG
jgi:hypothetical protein